jgi:3-methyl-2-oxobutanoate hydroxymethyltransferase
MGHIGLTPQRISVLGGFRAQGKTITGAQALLEDALALQAAGCFALVIECVPAEVAALITRALTSPPLALERGSIRMGKSSFIMICLECCNIHIMRR